ncbi:hypothetical protein VTK73DRAFT_1274 [Phialemonium thermophilum]|uniref:General stress protein FMN-binding split barrel domain-containing protein n=1 Tax=Phialemonium thermophilum TaxID=223376 RepID=A0ABR3XB01_9PEZI
MSSGQGFSNASTGSKPADPYKQANTDSEVTTEQKIEDLVAFISNIKYGMMTTRDAKTGHLVSRAMALAGQEAGGVDLLFHTNTESHKTDELSSDPHANISFINSTNSEWASISGTADIITDRSLIKKYYSPTLKAWLGDLGDGVHDGGENDPRIGIIRVKTVKATYSISSKNFVAKAIDVVQSTATGKPAQINKLREISEEEIKYWRTSN